MQNLKIGDAYAGGIVFYIDPASAGHGLVCAPHDQGERVEWDEANALCKALQLSGYSDWRLPAKDELNLMYINLHKRGLGGLDALGGFTSNYYWSSDRYDANNMWFRYFGVGFPENDGDYNPGCARAVRAF
jgi:hypothetical protein